MQHQLYINIGVTSAFSTIKLSDCRFRFLIDIFSMILLGAFRLLYQNVFRMLINETIIKVYKYVYERVQFLIWVDWSSSQQCGLLQPMLAWLITPAIAGYHQPAWHTTTCQKCSITTPIQNSWWLWNTLLFYIEHLCLYGQYRTLIFFEPPTQSSLYTCMYVLQLRQFQS